MADNDTLIAPATGPDALAVATDEIDSVWHQRVKLEFGEDGTATDVSATDPLPVTVANSPDVNVANTPDMNVVNTPDVHVTNTPDVHVVTVPAAATVAELDIADGTANTVAATLDVLGYSSIFLQVSGDFDGSITLAALGDPAEGGPTFHLLNPSDGSAVTSLPNAGSHTTQFLVGSLNNIRELTFARGVDWTSGSAHLYAVLSTLASPYVQVTNGDTTPVPVRVLAASDALVTTPSVDGDLVSSGNPMPVVGTVDVSNFPAAQPVTDNGGSLTVDGTVSVGNFPATQPVSLASAVAVTDNGGNLSVDDGGGSLTVDGTVGISGTPNVAVTNTPTVDTELPAAAALADAAANPSAPTVGSALLTWNGTTWDRAKSATAGAGTTGTGVPAAGVLGFDGTNYQRVKTDSAGVVATAFAATPTVNVNTHAVTISGTATVDSELPAAAALADATANPTVPTVGADNSVYNGTTWDRAKSATAGAGTTGTGVPAAGVLGFDGTNYQRVKTDSAGVVATAFAATPTVDTELPTAAVLADAATNPTVPTVGADNATFNGTTWDRARSATSGAGTTGTGIPAAGVLGFDGTNYQRVKTDSAGVVSTAFAATPTVDTELPAAAALSDTVANPTTPTAGAAGLVYNGSTWERARSAALADNGTTGLMANGGYSFNGSGWDKNRTSFNANGTVGTGIPASGILGFDGTAHRSVLTNAAGALATVAPATTSTLTSVSSSATNVTLVASNVNRKGLVIWNESTALLYVKFGATASATSYTYQVPAGSYLEMPRTCYTGIIDGIWASANGTARVTELT